MKEPEINLQTAGRLILNHLYDHPIEEISSNNLVNVIMPESKPSGRGSYTAEQIGQMLDQAQHEVESLILDGYVKGVRILDGGKVRHTNLKLTHKGEVQAIKLKRETKKLIVDL